MEIWKSLIYEGISKNNRFEISNDGKLKNVFTEKIYKTKANKEGYEQVCVSLGSRDNKKVIKIHIAVANTFIENIDNKPQVNHKDGNKLNNNDWNLEWCTNQENMDHAVLNGLINNNKLTEEQVRYIRLKYIPRSKEFGTKVLAKMFNMSQSRISEIINNKTYKHINI